MRSSYKCLPTFSDNIKKREIKECNETKEGRISKTDRERERWDRGKEPEGRNERKIDRNTERSERKKKVKQKAIMKN